MSERMTQDRVAKLVHSDNWTNDDCEDAQREILLARESERRLQDRIHALEVQQAELIRQMKEVTEQRNDVKAALDASDAQHCETFGRIAVLANALAQALRVMEANPQINHWSLGPSDAILTARAALAAMGRLP